MQNDFEHPNNTTTRPQLEKPVNHGPRNPLNFWRRSLFPHSRRRMMSGRYPNMGFRPFPSVAYRPNIPMPYGNSDLRYITPNVPTGTPVQRSPLYYPSRNMIENKSNQFQLPRSDLVFNDNEQSSEQKNHPDEFNASSDLWVETLAPRGRVYYYNCRTRQSTWNKPVSARIIEIDEIKRLAVRPQIQQCDKPRKEYPNQVLQQQTVSTHVNSFYPGNISMPPRLVMFPPNICNPPPPIFLSPTIQSVHNTASYNISVMIPPATFPFPLVTQNLLPNNDVISANTKFPQDLLPSNKNVEHDINVIQNVIPTTEVVDYNTDGTQNPLPSNEIIDYNTNVIQNLLPLSNEMDNYNTHTLENLLPSNEIVDCSASVAQSMLPSNEINYTLSDTEIMLSPSQMINENGKSTCVEISSNSKPNESQALINDKEIEFSNKKTETPDMNILEHNGLLSAPDDLNKIINCEKLTENVMKQDTEELIGLKSETEVSQDSDPDTSIMSETEGVSSQGLGKKSEDQQIDKSRPVSSTPIPGTCWCVVWTGDEKVFFYDSEHKISVWERPTVLMNRSDVDKMVEKSPLSLDFKAGKKEVRKTSSDRSDVIKKLKIEEEKKENSNLEESCEIKEVKNMDVEKITLEESCKELEKDSKAGEYTEEEKVKMFCEMLSEKVSFHSTWEKELHKIIFDWRYLMLPVNERKQIFTSYIKTKLLQEKNERHKELQCQKKAFVSLLEEAGVTSKTQFNDIVTLYSQDVRFMAIEKLKQKESIFNQYVYELTKKEYENEQLKREQKRKFIELLSEKNCVNKKWLEVQKIIADDERCKAIESNSLKECIFQEYIQEKSSEFLQEDRKKRISISLRNREEEVKRDLLVHLKEREREQEHHKYISAVSNFNALLEDLIKDSDIKWHSAKKILKADHRWDYVQSLGLEKREELFNQHINSLNCKQTTQFHRLLDELPDVTLKTSWLDIRKEVLKDPRSAKFSSSERKYETEFKNYLRKKLSLAMTEFKELLKETKLITHKSKSLLGTTNHLKTIERTLSQDKRYLNLESVRSERKTILLSYIDKLHASETQHPPGASGSADCAKSSKLNVKEKSPREKKLKF